MRSVLIHRCHVVTVLLAMAMMLSVANAQTNELPNPLTLETAMQMAQSSSHPNIEVLVANHAYAMTEVDRINNDYLLNAQLSVIPRLSDPAVSTAREYKSDGRVTLGLEKELYDFGRRRFRIDSVSNAVAGQQSEILVGRQKQQLKALTCFFEVLLADLQFDVDNERMALDYVRWQRALDRHTLGQISDVEMLDFESRYQDALVIRRQQESQQQRSRTNLSKALNVDSLAADLELPRMRIIHRRPPQRNVAMKKVLAQSPILNAYRAHVKAAHAEIAAQQSRRRPTITAQAFINQYQREVGSRNESEASLIFSIPLTATRQHRTDVAAAQANWRQRQAQYRLAELSVRQQVIDILLELELAETRLRAADIRERARDLALDRSRSIYEQGESADLGDAMIQLSEASLQTARATYTTVLNWAKLYALSGQLSYHQLMQDTSK